MENRSILDLAYRLNDILKERKELEIQINDLDKEYNDIVYELWNRIPSLKEDANIQPKRRVK